MPSDDGRATVEVSPRRARNNQDLAQERMSAVMISPGACPPSRRKGVSAATYVFVSAGSGRPVAGDPHSTLDHRCRLRGSRLRRSGHAARGDKRRQPECLCESSRSARARYRDGKPDQLSRVICISRRALGREGPSLSPGLAFSRGPAQHIRCSIGVYIAPHRRGNPRAYRVVSGAQRIGRQMSVARCRRRVFVAKARRR